MSILTKIFVVALVVLSLLLSAATITFVNSIDDYKRSMVALEAQVAAAEAKVTSGAAEAASRQATLQQQVDTATAAAQRAEGQIRDLQKEVQDKAAQLASASSDKTIADANVSKLTAAVNASEATKTQLFAQVGDLRNNLARLQSQNGDLNVAFSDASNKLAITEEARRVTSEQLAELRTQLDKVSGALRDRGVDPTRITSSGLAAGAPAINGVIRNTRQISGLSYAQISVGSDDGVKKDMEFNVLDRSNGQFLGKIKIVAVEPNEAVGQITGPNPQAIAAGAEVRTQL